MKKIINNKIMMFIIILLFFKPICLQYFSNLSIIENLFVYGKILVAILIVFDTLLESYPKVKVNPYLIMIFLFEFWIFGITLIKEGAIFRSFIDFITIFVLCLAIIKFIKGNKEKSILIIKRAFLTLVFFQLCSQILWPTGMPADLYYNNELNPLFFVTLDNGTTGLTCITLCVIFISKNIVKQTKKNIIINNLEVLLCIITAILSGSTTAMICTGLLFIYIVFSKLKFLKILDKWWIWLSIYILVNYLLISNNSLVSEIIYLITGKSGYTGRNYLWSTAISLINSSPLIGYGRLSLGYLEVWGGHYSSHNILLEMMLQGGWICFILWMGVIIYSMNHLKEIENYNTRRVLLGTVFMILIGLTMESNVHSEYLFLCLTIIYTFSKKGVGNERIN